jgi:hypothetical protein
LCASLELLLWGAACIENTGSISLISVGASHSANPLKRHAESLQEQQQQQQGTFFRR